jgi:hypothetical protein
VPDNAAASEAARNLIRSRWNKIIDPAERRAQTEPARLASLAKRAEQQRARRLDGQPVEPVTAAMSYEDALVAVVAQANYLDAEQKTLIVRQYRDAIADNK